MWTLIDVRDRFTEAAEIERRTPRGAWGPSTKLGFWPEYQRDFSDQTGWSGKTWQDIYESRNNRRIPPSPSEQSRAEEVLLEWTPLIREDRRRLVWYWAHSSAGGLLFTKVCRRMGWNRQTAYDRLQRVFHSLAIAFVNESKTLRTAGDIDSCTDSYDGAYFPSKLDSLSDVKSPPSWNDGSVSFDQPEIRDFKWATKQARREAKKRALLGAE